MKNLMIATSVAAILATAVPVCAAVGNGPGAEYIEEAQEYLKKGDLEAAIIQMKNAVRADPDNASIRQDLGNLYIRRGDALSAEKELSRALKLGGANDALVLDLAKAYLMQRKYDEVLSLVKLDEIGERYQGDAHLIIGNAYQGLNDLESALRYYEKGEEIKGRNDQIAVGIAQIYNIQKEYEKAEAKVDQALELNPKNVQALLLKGELIHRLQGPQHSLEYFENALQYAPNNVTAQIKKAGVLFDLKRDEEALGQLDETLKLSPRHPLANYLAAIIYARRNSPDKATEFLDRGGSTLDKFPPALMLRGVINYSGGNYAQAIYYLNRLIDMRPGHIMGRRLLGAALIRQNDPEQGIKILEPLVDANKADSVAYALLGSAYMKLGQYEEGTRYYEKAVEAKPGESRLQTQLALSRLAVGDTSSAEAQLNEILANDPEASQAAVFLVLIALREGNYAKALEDAKRLSRQRPENPVGYNLQGTALAGLGKIEDAKKMFNKALEIKPDYHSANLNLAQLYINEGKRDQAREIYENVREMDKKNLGAILGLVRLAALDGNVKGQETLLQEAVNVAPDNLSVRVQLSELYLKEKELEKAKAVAHEMTQDFPASGAGYEASGKLDLLMGDTASAVGNFQKMVGLIGKNQDAYQLLARAQRANGDFSSARRTYKEALEFAENKPPLLVDLIQLEKSQNNFTAAHAHLETLEELDDGALTYILKGQVLEAEKRMEEAIQAYQTAESKGAGGTKFVIDYADAYREYGDTGKAEEILLAHLQKHDTDAAVRHALASMYLTDNRLDEAIREYELLLQYNDQDALTLNNLAWLYSRKNSMDKALQLARKAYEVIPDNPSVTDTYAWILVQNGDNEKGLELLQKAVAKMPENMEIRYHLAVALKNLGRHESARRELEKVVTSGVRFNGVEEARQMLMNLSN
ncbi:XrtA/PEP-CTERM system TPR-repeat protein PrsT [Luteithermobacter gelatinilyticus]|uniref:XrtA/PEP-CTERM system TPR-repeat protein PrsT n=1 Tax=Luteithermobacter gelatinilyticus TaxID=2582913 RepID=UPI001106496C|nr:XrtA/PEP-CTERM system TPR-repeat protein PrsT [Luteithermobacter gelatinilyticus]